MDNAIILKLVEGSPKHYSSVDRLVNIYHLLSQALILDVPGDVVELGCYDGRTSIFIQTMLKHLNPERIFHVFDSFQGLPEKSEKDIITDEKLYSQTKAKFESEIFDLLLTAGKDEEAMKVGDTLSYETFFAKGGLSTTRRQFESSFHKWTLPLPIIHEGWFEQTLPYSLPLSIAFAYLDSDFYNSILTSLLYVYPRLSRHAIVVIDDYCNLEINSLAWSGCPGVKTACDEFFSDKPEKIHTLVGSDSLAMGYFRKQ
jgi:O-methyltransferase